MDPLLYSQVKDLEDNQMSMPLLITLIIVYQNIKF